MLLSLFLNFVASSEQNDGLPVLIGASVSATASVTAVACLWQIEAVKINVLTLFFYMILG